MSQKPKNPADEIWAIIKETAKERKKTEKMMQEASEERKKTAKIMQKNSEEMAKANAEMAKANEEAAEERKKTAKIMQKNSEEMAKANAEMAKANEEAAEERKKTAKIVQKNSEEMAKANAEMAKANAEAAKANEEMAKANAEAAEERKKTEKMIQRMSEGNERTQKIVDRMSEEGEKTRKMIKEANKEFHKNFGNIGNDWGRMAENLVRGNLAQRFTDRGIKVEEVHTNLKNTISEFDIVAINGEEIVIVEVKSRLGLDDVERFLSQVKTFRNNWPKIAGDKKIYGGLAYVVKRSDQAFLRAKEEGLFIISVSGDILIENKKEFQPTAIVN